MIRRILSFILLIALALTVNAQTRYRNHSQLSKGKWVKIRVKDAGVYSITSSMLSGMGFSNPDKVSLYGYNLPILPETHIENISDDLTEIPLYRSEDGTLLFYSCGTTRWTRSSVTSSEFTHVNNPYSRYIYYFITEQTETVPLRVKSKSIDNSTLTPTSTFYDHALIEADEYSFINTGRTFYEKYDFANGKKKTYTVDLPGVCSNEASLTVKFAAAGTTASRLTVSANDTTYRYISYSALSEYTYAVDLTNKYKFSQAKPQTTVTLTTDGQSGISGHLDYIQIDYRRSLDLSGSQYLAFRPSDSESRHRFQISNANSGTSVWNVTPGDSIYEFEGKLDGTTYTVCTPSCGKSTEYVAVNTNANFPKPEVVGTVDNQDLHSLSDIDLVIIVPANGRLSSQAQRLADAHTKRDGIKCAVVRADQVYNEFSSGTPDITAYRRLMKMLYDKAGSNISARPKNICLFGDCVWDNRMVTSGMILRKQEDYLLCYESNNSISHTNSYVSEEYITLLADGKGTSPLKEKLDCGVGRIPVTTEAEAKTVVDKLIAYIGNEQVGDWKNTICMMADDGNANIHMKDAEAITKQVSSLYPDLAIKKIYWDSFSMEQTATGNSYINAYKAITKQVDDGALIMNYTGHGAAYCLSHEQVLKTADFATWNSPRLPLWIHAACDVSPFDMDEENIGEVALLNPRGGAMGVLSTARTVYSSQNRILNNNFMKYVLAQDSEGNAVNTLGEALALAKSDIASPSIGMRDSLNKAHFVLLGDPAIRLAMPRKRIAIDSFTGGITTDSGKHKIGAGSVVTVTGHIITDRTDSIAYNGTIYSTVFDSEETITCKNNAGEDIEPYKFVDRKKTLYAGTDSIHDGKFTISFIVPLDINYSDAAGLLYLYASDNSNTREAHGKYTEFLVGGTSGDTGDDREGPIITISLNGTVFTNTGDSVISTDVMMNETPYFTAHLSDKSGISTTGSGVGHDISLVIDNSLSMTYNLNNYYQSDTGLWTDGNVSFSIPQLTSGPHTLLFRAWDNFNNPSSITLNFEVKEGQQPNIFDVKISRVNANQLTLQIDNDRPQSMLNIEVAVFDMSGRQMWHGAEQGVSTSESYIYSCNLNAADGHLTPGIYICKVSVSTSNGAKANKSKKFIVTQ